MLGWWPFFSNQRLAAKRIQKWWKKILLRWVYTIGSWFMKSYQPDAILKKTDQNWTQITRESAEKFKPSFTLFSGRKKLEEVQQQSISFETARKWNASLGFKQLIREMISHESLPSSKIHLVYIFQRQPLMPDVWKILETNLKSHVSSHWVSLSESVHHTLPKNNSKFAPWK